MKTRFISILVAAAVFFSFAPVVQASTVTIDFEEFSIGDGPANIDDWINSKGYEFTGTAWPGPYPDGQLATIYTGESGSKSLGASAYDPGLDGYGAEAQVSMRKADGGAFAIHELDFFILTDPFGGGGSLWGELAGGGSASLTSPVGTADWLNLQEVTFYAYGDGYGLGGLTSIQIDNISVSAVPVPAAVWLFGSALAGLGWMRRRKTV
jgi:hypothetical protein